PPKPRIEAVRIVDMSSSNSWAEFAGLFRSTRQAFLDHERSKTELKANYFLIDPPQNNRELAGNARGRTPNFRSKELCQSGWALAGIRIGMCCGFEAARLRGN